MDTNIKINEQTFGSIQEKRDFLRKLSNAVTDQVKSGEFETINDAIITNFYKEGNHTQFKTFNEWQKDGYSIIKGSKAFLVWGRPVPKDAATQGTKTLPTDSDLNDYYPLAFLFSNAQVERRPSNV